MPTYFKDVLDFDIEQVSYVLKLATREIYNYNYMLKEKSAHPIRSSMYTYLGLFYLQTGFLAACPYLFKAILGPLGGITADMLIRYKMCTVGTVRKVFYAAGEKGNIKFTCLYPIILQ